MSKTELSGIEAFLEILAAADVRYLFGNPGSTELPLNDALVEDSRFHYIFGLQEVPLTAMADGYAMASGQLGVVCVHICCGLGNAMGMLYNAYCEGTPLLILAGQQDRRLRFGEPVLAGDMVAVTRPWTKWAAEVQRVEDVPAATRRAVQTALTPPTGPVFLALPVDVQLERSAELDLTAPHRADRRVRPPLDALRQAAELLALARNPAILAGSRVAEAGAVPELMALAEQLGAPVLGDTSASRGRLPMPVDHSLYAGTLPLWSPDIRQRLEEFDVLLAVGLDLFRLYIHREPACPIPEEIRLIHLDADPEEVGKNYPVEVGLLGDPQAGLAELGQLLPEFTPTGQELITAQRRARCAALRADDRRALQSEMDAQRNQRPMSLHTFVEALQRVLPPDAVLVEEAITTHLNLLERSGLPGDPSGYFAHRGWALGWGLGCAVGVKLAWPERPVVALLGDGSALYSIQGLWTAAHHRIPATFVIVNNAQYQILKMGGKMMQLPQMIREKHLGIDLVDPEIDFVGLARSFGVQAHRVTEPEELSARLDGSLRQEEPLLLDVAVER